MNRNAIIGFVGLLLAGCAAAPPTQSEWAAANFGIEPNHRHKAYVEGVLIGGLHLRDPYSAIFKLPYRKSYVDRSGQRIFGYEFLPMVNAKNAFGGYVGETPVRPVFIHAEKDQIFLCFDGRCHSSPM